MNNLAFTVETHSGMVVDLVNPKPEQIYIHDIAWSLSRQSRFNGHTSGSISYSVAQHSCWVATRVLHETKDRHAALYALLHDAHEAYIGDIVSPLKNIARLSHVVGDIERALQYTIHQAYDLPPPAQRIIDVIKHYDRLALAVEAYHLLPSRGNGWGLPTPDDETLALFDNPTTSARAYCGFIVLWEQLKAQQVAA